MLGEPVSSEAVGVGKGLPTHLTAEQLLTSTLMDRLVMGGQVEVMAERLPAYRAGVEPGWRLGVGALRLDILV